MLSLVSKEFVSEALDSLELRKREEGFRTGPASNVIFQEMKKAMDRYNGMIRFAQYKVYYNCLSNNRKQIIESPLTRRINGFFMPSWEYTHDIEGMDDVVAIPCKFNRDLESIVEDPMIELKSKEEYLAEALEVIDNLRAQIGDVIDWPYCVVALKWGEFVPEGTTFPNNL